MAHGISVTMARTLGRRLAAARRARGWTQAALANALGIESSSLSRYERGGREAPVRLVLATARLLGTDVAHLLGADERPAVDEASAEDLLHAWTRLASEERVLVVAIARALGRAPR
jgi:transcriptional regulator with XRE-family HTH domain